MAGFSGGRKSVCPGIAGMDNIRYFHSPEVLESPFARSGNLTKNPCHKFALDFASAAGADFIVNVTFNMDKKISGIFCGDLKKAHQAGVKHCARESTVYADNLFDIVITTNGGFPLDRDLYQTVKGLVSVLEIVRKGGIIICAAECRDGIGSAHFKKLLFGMENPDKFMKMIRTPGFFVPDQWEVEELIKVLKKTKILLYTTGVSTLEIKRAGIEPLENVEQGIRTGLKVLGKNASIAVVPEGPYVISRLRKQDNLTSYTGGNLYGNIDLKLINRIESIIGKENVISEKEKLEDYSHDEFALSSIRQYPGIAVKPENTLQISEILKIAQEARIPVIPRGGATGLSGGCVPVPNGIVLSLERMNRILEIDRGNLMAVLEPGVTLREFYAVLKKEKLFFPPHPGEESAMIGGIIATNAGGARAVKYGTVRNFVRGVKAVLPSGEIINAGGKIIKDSSGYSLLHLLLGSEGTLGIITEAVLSVMPVPGATASLVIPFENLSDALAGVPEILASGILPLAVEFVSREIIEIAEDYIGKKWPVHQGNVYLFDNT